MEKENGKVEELSTEKVVKLRFPIEWGKEEITELTIKRPKGKHLQLLPKDYAMKDLAKLAARSSGYEEALLGELDGKDFLKVVEATQSFLDDGE